MGNNKTIVLYRRIHTMYQIYNQTLLKTK